LGRGLTVEQMGGVLLLTGPSNFVCHWNIPAEKAAETVAWVADRLRGRAEGLTWNVYGHDCPARSSDHLVAAGLLVEHRSTLMVLDLSAGGPSMPAGIEVRRVADQAMLRDFVRLSAEAFGQDADWQRDAFKGGEVARFARVVIPEPAPSRGATGQSARYIALNPVKARLTKPTQDWPWSSAPALLAGRSTPYVDVAPALARIGDPTADLSGEDDAEGLWRSLLAAETVGPTARRGGLGQGVGGQAWRAPDAEEARLRAEPRGGRCDVAADRRRGFSR
jgi:hypothetical protein